jgi:hypothetical protein
MDRMSMYSELLEASYQSQSETEPDDTSGDLLASLCQFRRRLVQAEANSGDGDGPVEMLVPQLDYDLALLRLCRVRDIACDPALFAQPLEERHRLEQALEDAGFDYKTLP